MNFSDPRQIRIEEYTYDLPTERIAAFPLEDRTRSRLLVYQDGKIRTDVFRNMGTYLPSNSILVLNQTRVVNARLVFHNANGARIELFCLEPDRGMDPAVALNRTGQVEWCCLVGNRKRWKEGVLQLTVSTPAGEADLHARLIEHVGTESRIEFSWTPSGWTFAQVLEHIGNVPLPPYLNREVEEEDDERYNTVYARKEGSVAAPTAGLHFSEEMLLELEHAGHVILPVTLHVGAGTFRPVSSESIGEHDMHAERIHVESGLIRRLRDHAGTRPLLAVGTTSLRTIESLYWFGLRCLSGELPVDDLLVDQWDPYAPGERPAVAEALDAVLQYMQNRGLDALQGRTRLLIAPGYDFRLVDILQTNFHQPGSTLLLLVAAFIGEDWRKVYENALNEGFRFLSFGDASLLFRRVDKG